METSVFVSCLAVVFIMVSGSYGLPRDSCSTCKAHLGNIKENVLRQIRQQPIESLLGAICESAPTVYKADCYALGVEKVSALVVHLGGADIGGLCEALGECGEAGYREVMLTDDSGLKLHFDTVVQNGMICRMCTTTMQMIQRYLHYPNHQAIILRLLKYACKLLPFVGHECLVLVHHYGRLIISLANHFLTPHLCYTFHMCNKEPVAVMDELCMPCELGAGILEDFVNDPNSEDEVKALALEFCSQMAQGTDETCASLVNQYLPEMFQYLRSVRYESVCSALMSCEKRDVEIAGYV